MLNPKSAVLLLAYGGPDSLDDIEPYLRKVRGGQAVSPALVAEYRRRYALIGGRSPLPEITRRQMMESVMASDRMERSHPRFRGLGDCFGADAPYNDNPSNHT